MIPEPKVPVAPQAIRYNTGQSAPVSYHITFLLVSIDMVLETSVSFIHLTRLIAREDFIEPCRREGFG
jgi:hypothetical protein